jgi:hypothetical protein
MGVSVRYIIAFYFYDLQTYLLCHLSYLHPALLLIIVRILIIFFYFERIVKNYFSPSLSPQKFITRCFKHINTHTRQAFISIIIGKSHSLSLHQIIERLLIVKRRKREWFFFEIYVFMTEILSLPPIQVTIVNELAV